LEVEVTKYRYHEGEVLAKICATHGWPYVDGFTGPHGTTHVDLPEKGRVFISLTTKEYDPQQNLVVLTVKTRVSDEMLIRLVPDLFRKLASITPAEIKWERMPSAIGEGFELWTTVTRDNCEFANSRVDEMFRLVEHLKSVVGKTKKYFLQQLIEQQN
jgi:hypothetical protein